jgi:TatD DNase family protein
MLIETDAPYLAPVPMRGRRNEPSFVPHVAAKIAELHGTGAEVVAARTSENFRCLFKVL